MGTSGDWRVLVPSGDDLGESPVWDPRTGTVAWIDASEGSALHRMDWRTGAHSRYPLATRCTAIGLGPPDAYVAALGDGVGLLDSRGSLLEKVGLGDGPSGALTNDGACSPDGAFWFGTTTHSRQPLAGTLWRYDGAGIASVTTGYTLSNGIAWLEDGETFYHVDTFERIVRRNRWDPDRRRLDEDLFLTFDEEDGLPDGIAPTSREGCGSPSGGPVPSVGTIPTVMSIMRSGSRSPTSRRWRSRATTSPPSSSLPPDPPKTAFPRRDPGTYTLVMWVCPASLP